MESIYIPTSVTSLAYRCFGNCPSLTTLTLPVGLSYVYSGYPVNGVFQNDTAICDVAIIGEGQLIRYHGNYPQQNTPWKVGSDARNEVTVTIRKGITTITQSAFQNCRNVVSVNIPSTVTTIEDYAFKDCTSLTATGDDEYVLPETAFNIGDYAFDGCTALTGKLPATLESIGTGAFKNCTSITGEVIINEAITRMSQYAFDGCTGITSIYVPTSVTSLAYRCFANCASLTTLTLPAGLNYHYSVPEGGTTVHFRVIRRFAI